MLTQAQGIRELQPLGGLNRAIPDRLIPAQHGGTDTSPQRLPQFGGQVDDRLRVQFSGLLLELSEEG